MRSAITISVAFFLLSCTLAACDARIPAKKTTAPAAVASEPPQAEPASSTKASAALSHEVRIAAEGLTLEGTLDFPTGKGPFPALVLVHGSGPHSRDLALPGQLGMAFAQPIRAFKELSQQLNAHGFAVLRYDKRTCYTANGCTNKYPVPSDAIVVHDFKKDAQAALRYLATRPEIDKKRIFVVGHSQGAGLVPAILQDMPELKAGVSIAAPGTSFAGTVQSQIDKLFSNTPESQHDLLRTQLKDLIAEVDKLKALEAGQDIKDKILGASPEFSRSQIQVAKEALSLAKSVDRPILVLRGTLDWNIPPADFAEWKEALQSSPHAAKHRVQELPEVTHALNRLKQSDPSKLQPSDVEYRVHPSVAESIADFLGKIN